MASIHPPPRIVALAGPNGAGKSTAARALLQGALQVTEFVNADVIAQGLSAFDPASVAVSAGRIMLTRLRELATARADFALETTLASRTYAPWLDSLVKSGYEFHLVFLWLPSPEAAIARVAERVRRGGHSIPEQVIRRRYHAGLRNFFKLYNPMASTWQLMDNSSRSTQTIATGTIDGTIDVVLTSLWQPISNTYRV